MPNKVFSNEQALAHFMNKVVRVFDTGLIIQMDKKAYKIPEYDKIENIHRYYFNE